MKDATITIRMTTAFHRRLKREAEKRQLSMTVIIILALRKYFGDDD